jgi:hypothetical protein
MAAALPNKAGAPSRQLSAWRIVTWLVMLLAAFSLITNLRAVLLVSNAMERITAPEELNQARIAMAWAVAYVFAALAVMATALLTIRRRERARRVMRIIAVVLAVWAAYTAWDLFGQWHDLRAVLSQPDLAAAARNSGERIQKIFLASGVLKLVSIPVLGWLAWCLGRPSVRAQFIG